MAIDVWFPLAIYYSDLPEQAKYKATQLERIYQLCDAGGEKKSADNFSWTGDVHTVDQLHNDSVFAWLTRHVEEHALHYLNALGHNMDKVDLYIQRSWPIIATRGQSISRHAHHNANLSAVYYVSVPKRGNAGQTRFFNAHKYNELSRGIDSKKTGGYSEYNSFNYQRANYDPIEGRLLIFPAKQLHDVAANKTSEDRVSVSFDLIMTAKKISGQSTPEFLMPSPDSWKKVFVDAM